MKEKFKEAQKKIVAFFDGKGFYIVLFLCAAAIGISGYVIFTPAEDTPQDIVLETDGTTGAGGYIEAGGESDPENGEDTEVSVSLPVSDENGSESETDTAESGTTEPPETHYSFVWPLDGEVAKSFSGSKLVFSATMDDWRTHNGTDIAAPTGTQVKAITKGVVVEISQGELEGVYVTIEHVGGYTVKYANLQPKVLVVKGQTVAAGTVIGGVGETMQSEIGDKPHLHLEVIKNGDYIDPETLLPEK